MSKICLGNKRNTRWITTTISVNSCTSNIIREYAGNLISPNSDHQHLEKLTNALSNHCVRIDFDAYEMAISQIVFRTDDEVKKSRVSAYEYLVP